MSINRIWLSDEPERMYGGQKSIEAMLEYIYEFAMPDGFREHVPPTVVVLKHPEQTSSFSVPDPDRPVTGGGC